MTERRYSQSAKKEACHLSTTLSPISTGFGFKKWWTKAVCWAKLSDIRATARQRCGSSCFIPTFRYRTTTWSGQFDRWRSVARTGFSVGPNSVPNTPRLHILLSNAASCTASTPGNILSMFSTGLIHTRLGASTSSRRRCGRACSISRSRTPLRHRLQHGIVVSNGIQINFY